MLPTLATLINDNLSQSKKSNLKRALAHLAGAAGVGAGIASTIMFAPAVSTGVMVLAGIAAAGAALLPVSGLLNARAREKAFLLLERNKDNLDIEQAIAAGKTDITRLNDKISDKIDGKPMIAIIGATFGMMMFFPASVPVVALAGGILLAIEGLHTAYINTFKETLDTQLQKADDRLSAARMAEEQARQSALANAPSASKSFNERPVPSSRPLINADPDPYAPF